MNATHPQERWGWLAQYESAEALIRTVEKVAKAFDDEPSSQNSCRVPLHLVEAFTPFPVEGLGEALRYRRSPMPWIILAGGLLGGVLIYALEYWINLYAYPLNIGGRPLHSWPAFVPAAFEGVILGASLFAILGLMWVCGLPRLHHPVFEVEAFKRASTDGFFLAVQSEESEVRERLIELGAAEVWEVPNV